MRQAGDKATAHSPVQEGGGYDGPPEQQLLGHTRQERDQGDLNPVEGGQDLLVGALCRLPASDVVACSRYRKRAIKVHISAQQLQ
jgi:hypothetical protein